MICRRVVLAAALGGCAAVDVPVTEIAAQATGTLALVPPTPAPTGTTYDWRLAARPARSTASDPGVGPATTFVPDIRGAYLIDLWLDDGVSADLIRRYEIDAAGAPPVATFVVPAQATVGATVNADGSGSRSPEGLAITFAWRLTMVPRGSAAVLATTDKLATSFGADVAGAYVLELSVFDGELWSGVTTMTIDAM